MSGVEHQPWTAAPGDPLPLFITRADLGPPIEPRSEVADKRGIFVKLLVGHERVLGAWWTFGPDGQWLHIHHGPRGKHRVRSFQVTKKIRSAGSPRVFVFTASPQELIASSTEVQ